MITPSRSYQGYRGVGIQPGQDPLIDAIQNYGDAPQAMPDYTRGPSASAVGREREIADILTGQALQTRPTVSGWDGLSQLGQAFLARRASKRAEGMEAEYTQAQAADQQRMYDTLGLDEQQRAHHQLTGGLPEQERPFIINDQAFDPVTGERLVDARNAPERPIETDFAGRKRYKDTGELVFPDAEPAPPPPITPTDQRRFNLQQQRLDLDRDRFAAEQSPQYDGVVSGGFNNSFVGPPPSDQSAQLFAAAFGEGDGDFVTAPGEQSGNPSLTPGSSPFGPLTGQGEPKRGTSEQTYATYRASRQASRDQEALEEYTQAADTARDVTDPKLREIEGLLDPNGDGSFDGGAPVGPAAGFRAGASRFVPQNDAAEWVASRLGIPDQEQGGQLYATKAAVNQLVLDVMGKLKGVASDNDTQLIRETAPEWWQRPEQIMMIVGVQRSLGQRAREKSYIAEEWTNRIGGLSLPNQNGQTFYQFWDQYISENSILPQGFGATTARNAASENDGWEDF